MSPMRSGLFSAGLILAAALSVALLPVSAHHSFVMFDTTKQVTLEGTVSNFEWTNPHAYIEVDVPEAVGGSKHWSVEMGSTSILMKGGWKFSTLKKGDKVTLVLNPLKDGKPAGLLISASLADGRVLGNGPGRGPQGKDKGK